MKNLPSIGFAKELAPMILDGSKFFTYRLGNKFDFLNVGDKINARDSSNNKNFGIIVIISKTYTLFNNLPLDRKGHEIYKSKDHQKEIFKGYYKREIDDNEKVLVFEFHLLETY